jgi:hypothetical protein
MAAFATFTQEQEEQFALDQFRGASGLLPGKDHRGGNPPDFVVTNGTYRTSVETTRFHKGAEQKGGSAEAARESTEQRFVDRAQTIFEAAHPNLYAEVRPYLVHGLLTRGNVDEYAALFAVVVPDLMPPAPSAAERVTRVDVQWSELANERLTDVLTHVSIARSLSLRRHAWLIGSAGFASTDVGELEFRIRRKERDLDRYRDQFDARWLLIYGMPQSSAFFDFEYLRPGMFKSKFDGVAFIDVFSARYVVIA